MLLTFKIKTEFDEYQVKFGDEEVRNFKDYPEPFPLYPHEELKQDVT